MLKALLRLRKYVAAWGALVFCVMCFSLYLMMENVSNRNNVMDENFVVNIQSKIRHIEASMDRNRDIIASIKSAVREMHKGNLKPLQSLSWNDSRETNAVSRNTDNMCLLKEHPEAKSDINMLELYNKISFKDIDGGVWKQGWNIEYPNSDAKTLHIYVVPHTHCDPGWIKTYRQYYNDQVRHILNNMVTKLSEDRNRKFIYAEISFFSLWWQEISEKTKDQVKSFLNNGQLELVTGGWVMNDEAAAHYSAIVNQLTDGHLWLNSTLGYKPTSHWSIDPFGYSSTNPYLIKQTGIDAMLIQRVHYIVKKHLARKQQMEFLWRQQWDTKASNDIFTHIMPFYSYDVPHTCGPDPKICCQFDFARLPGLKYSCPWGTNPVVISASNVAERATTLLDQYRKKSMLYQTSVLFIPLGDDFRYDTVEEYDNQMQNYEALFKYINSHSELKAKIEFGTLSEYFAAVKSELSQSTQPAKLPSLTGDFFSYSDREDYYWTGYFTSRPFYKHMDRVVEHYVRAADIAFSLASSHFVQQHGRKLATKLSQTMDSLVHARRSLSLFQHHDGITGTAKDHVVIDYGKKLLAAIDSCQLVIMDCLTHLMSKEKASSSDAFSPSKSQSFNPSEDYVSHDSLPEKFTIDISTSKKKIMIFNSLGHSSSEIVTVRVNSQSIEVTDDNDNVVSAQVSPVWIAADDVSSTVFEVSFVATLPALGTVMYTISKATDMRKASSQLASIEVRNTKEIKHASQLWFELKIPEQGPFSLSHRHVNFDADGLLSSVMSKTSKKYLKTKLSFVKYGVERRKERSGAYLFLPDGPAKDIPRDKPIIHIIRGPLFSEVHVFLPNVEHRVRLNDFARDELFSVDVRNIVDIRAERNFELAMRLDTNIVSNRTFYTDQNGFQMQKRKTLDKLPLQGNFYPMTTNVFIEDSDKRLNVMSGQSLGVSSLFNGRLELMLDRRLDQDDNRGLAQPVHDNLRTPNEFRLYFEDMTSKSKARKASSSAYPTLQAHWLLQSLIHPPLLFPQGKSPLPELSPTFSPLTNDLPCDVHLLSVRALYAPDSDETLVYTPRGDVAVTFHRYGFECSSPCSNTDGKVDLTSLFKNLKFKNIKQTSLTLLHKKKDTSIAELSPMELQTYQLTLR